MSKRLIFFGTEDFSAASLQALIDAEFDISAVVTKPDFTRGRSKQFVQPVVKKLAAKNDISILQPSKMSEIVEFVQKNGPFAGILVSYGRIIPQSLIELFEPGIINLHPSKLPRYRGPSPIEAAILHGDSETALSIMQLTAKMDAGPVYTQKIVRLTGSETKPELYEQLANDGAALLVQTLPRILDGTLTPEPQNDSEATYCPLLTKEDGVLRPQEKTAPELEREIRAYLGYPKSRTTLFDKYDVIVTKASVASSLNDSPITLACKDSTYLSIDELVAPSGRTMSASDFLRGYNV